jgi:hypothetical protein
MAAATIRAGSIPALSQPSVCHSLSLAVSHTRIHTHKCILCALLSTPQPIHHTTTTTVTCPQSVVEALNSYSRMALLERLRDRFDYKDPMGACAEAHSHTRTYAHTYLHTVTHAAACTASLLSTRLCCTYRVYMQRCAFTRSPGCAQVVTKASTCANARGRS